MRIDGPYDAEADIAWVRFEGYDPGTVEAEETEAGSFCFRRRMTRLTPLGRWRRARKGIRRLENRAWRVPTSTRAFRAFPVEIFARCSPGNATLVLS
jgi:hypothetical protein